MKDEGLLEKFEMSLMEARTLIMDARLKLELISQEDYEIQMGLKDVSLEPDTNSD